MGVENKEEYDELKKDSSNTHIIFGNRTSVPDTKTISGTQSLFQVQGFKERRSNRKYDLNIFHLQCSCISCQTNPQCVQSCHYLHDRNWKLIAVSELVEQEDQESTREDYKNITVSELKDIRRELGQPLSGRKQEFIDRVMKSFTKDNAEECKDENV